MFHHEVIHDLTTTEHEKGRPFTPISFFPRCRGKMKKGDRKGQNDFDGSTDRIFHEVPQEHEGKR
jgi:hypothetical protein